MALLAVYSPKGGVGKTSLAVNLAWSAAALSSRRTLLWDLDAQGAASRILAADRKPGKPARAVIERDVAPEELILETSVRGLDILPADSSLRTLDIVFDGIGAKKRMLRIGEMLQKRYDRVIVDCPPGLGATAEQIIRSASLIVVPLIPSTLSTSATAELTDYLSDRRSGGPSVMPVFNLVDRRRASHRAALAATPGQPAIPMASAIEQMADRHAPLGVYAPRSPGARAIATLWTRVERELIAAG